MRKRATQHNQRKVLRTNGRRVVSGILLVLTLGWGLEKQTVAQGEPNSNEAGLSLRWQPVTETDKSPFAVLEGDRLQDVRRSLAAAELHAELKKTLQIFVVEDGKRAQDPVLSKLRRTETFWEIHPRFRLEEGLTYDVVLMKGLLSPTDEIYRRLQLAPKERAKPTQLVGVFPSGNSIPENLLRCYLLFDAPMSRGHATKFVRLLDSDGREVDLPFLELEDELWNGSLTRLTLLLDPARVKRGLKPNLDEGRALETGQRYQLVIDQQWPDATGRPLLEGLTREWRIQPADYIQPNLKQWRLQSPRANTLAPLTIEFGSSMDFALASRMIRVTDAEGSLLKGESRLDQHETIWHWQPEVKWEAKTYTVVIDSRLADACGNSFRKPFEVTGTPSQEAPPAKPMKLHFKVAAQD